MCLGLCSQCLHHSHCPPSLLQLCSPLLFLHHPPHLRCCCLLLGDPLHLCGYLFCGDSPLLHGLACNLIGLCFLEQGFQLHDFIIGGHIFEWGEDGDHHCTTATIYVGFSNSNDTYSWFHNYFCICSNGISDKHYIFLHFTNICGLRT